MWHVSRQQLHIRLCWYSHLYKMLLQSSEWWTDDILQYTCLLAVWFIPYHVVNLQTCNAIIQSHNLRNWPIKHLPQPLWQKQNLFANLQHLQAIVCGSNQQEPQTTLPGAYSIHKIQQTAISICSAYPSQPARIWAHGRNNDPLLNNNFLVTPCEQFFIHSLQKEEKLISEQNPGELNPILQLTIDPSQPHVWPNYSENTLYAANTTCLRASQDSCQHFKVCTVLFYKKKTSLTDPHNHILSPHNARPHTTCNHSELT